MRGNTKNANILRNGKSWSILKRTALKNEFHYQIIYKVFYPAIHCLTCKMALYSPLSHYILWINMHKSSYIPRNHYGNSCCKTCAEKYHDHSQKRRKYIYIFGITSMVLTVFSSNNDKHVHAFMYRYLPCVKNSRGFRLSEALIFQYCAIKRGVTHPVLFSCCVKV